MGQCELGVLDVLPNRLVEVVPRTDYRQDDLWRAKLINIGDFKIHRNFFDQNGI